MPNIAIIGTNGAGKTVFITVLANRLDQWPKADFVLDPEPKTFKYLATNWRKLNQREWPYPTASGNSSDLHWKVKLSIHDGLRTGEMRVIDASGHDVRPIFADDRVTAMGALPAAQQSLVEYCRAADIVVFVADLDDYIEKPDGKEIEDEAILKSAMDFLRKHSRKYCLVLAKIDRHRDYIAQQGGWEAVAAKNLSSVRRSHLASGVPCFQVACVNKTEMIIERNASGEEELRLVPTPGFDSDGLDPFIDWLVKSLGSKPPDKVAPPPPSSPPSLWPMGVAGAVGFFVFLANCTRTVPGHVDWWGPVPVGSIPEKTEFDPVSIFLAFAAIFVVWGILTGIRLLIKSGSKNG